MIHVASHTLKQKPEKRARNEPPQRLAVEREVAEIANWIRRRASKVTRGEKVIIYRELKTILSSLDYVLENPHDNSIDIVRYDPVKKLGLLCRKVVIERKHIWTMCWPGENRQASFNEIKRVREKCHLREEDGYDSEAFYNYAVVVDTFVNHYRKTLRRLAHA